MSVKKYQFFLSVKRAILVRVKEKNPTKSIFFSASASVYFFLSVSVSVPKKVKVLILGSGDPLDGMAYVADLPTHLSPKHFALSWWTMIFTTRWASLNQQSVGTYGDLWGPFGTYGDLRGPIATYGELSGPMGIYGDPWGPIGPMGACGDLRGPMESYEDLWGPTGTFAAYRRQEALHSFVGNR